MTVLALCVGVQAGEPSGGGPRPARRVSAGPAAGTVCWVQMRVRTLVIVLLSVGAVLAVAAGMLIRIVDGGTCAPHHGGDGCGFEFALAIPWFIAVAQAAAAIAVTVRWR